MGSRILEPEENGAMRPFSWQQLNVHLDSKGRAECGTGDPAAAEREQALAMRVSELEHLLETRAKEAAKSAEDAHSAGIREGEQRGRTQAAGEMRTTLERLSQTIADAAGLRAQFRKEAEGEVVALALAIARRILHREVTLNADAIQGIIAVALSKLQSQESCKVRVHPQHAAPVKTALERIAPGQKIEVAGDPSLAPGDAVLETQRGKLDASIDSQMAEIERGLADRMGEQG